MARFISWMRRERHLSEGTRRAVRRCVIGLVLGALIGLVTSQIAASWIVGPLLALPGTGLAALFGVELITWTHAGPDDPSALFAWNTCAYALLGLLAGLGSTLRAPARAS